MKKFLAYLLTFSLVFSSMPITFALEDDGQETVGGEFAAKDNIPEEEPEQSALENDVALMSDNSEGEEIVHEEILTYSDYRALEEEFLGGGDLSGRYFKLSGEIVIIDDECFGIDIDGGGNFIKIFGAVSPDYLNCNATVYCNADENRECFLCMTDIEYGEKNIFEIGSEEDLKTINSKLPKIYELKCDIVLSENWEPIEFYGDLEGNGYTISNLNVISDQEYSYDYAGLFSTNYGTIRDLNVETNESGVLSLRGSTATAGIIAGSNEGTIENCTAAGVVEGLKSAGGIAGNNGGVIDGCYAAAVMENSYSYQGGLIGCNFGTVTNSHALSNIKASSYLGGLIGRSSGGEISNCYSEGNVSGSSYIGGLVGENYTKISNSYSTCNVIGSDNMGGLSGFNNANISNSHASGSIVGSSYYVGGLIGRASYGNLSDCYFTGSVKSTSEQVGGLIGQTDAPLNITDCYARATIQGTYRVGGLIGLACYSPNITRCYTGGGIIASGQYAGGLVGFYESYNRAGTIELSFSNADVWGASSVGGLIGQYNCRNYSLTVKNCYSTGAVDGSDYVGGLIGCQNDGGHFYNSYAVGKVASANNSGGITGWRSGISSALIEKCYYDTETTEKSTSENGIGKTTAEMKTEENYLTWDFDTIWAIDASVNNGYPYLRDNYNVNTDSTIVINTEEDLRSIADNLSGNYILNNNIELTEDWSMVGDSNLAFYGTFDGNGYTISNFNMNGNTCAFIHSVAVSGVVKNLNIEAGINAEADAAGIAINNYGTIDNCTVSGKITSSGSGSTVGGIAANNYAEINNCHTETFLNGGGFTGGIVGYLTKGSVKGCWAVGSAVGVKYVGGSIGYMSGGKVTATASAGIVRCSDTSNSEQASGGLIGRINHEIANSVTLVEECGSTADVSGYYYVGGLIGRVYGYSNSSYVKYIKNCYSNGNVSGSNYTGNFIGDTDYYWTFQNCYTGGKSMKVDFGGYNSDYVKQNNCFYMSDYYSGGLFTGKKQAQLKNRDTFENWDFDNVWAIDPSINGGMPYLKNAPALNEDNTYILIRSESDLENIANDLTAKYKLATDITITSAHKMIGTEENPFMGILDGSGFTIINKTADEDGTIYPVFGVMGQSAALKNLVVDTAVDTTKTKYMSGGLALVNSGTVENVTVKGSVKGANDYVGGIVAKNNGYIYNSHSEADVDGVNYVGGAVGLNSGNIVKSSAKGKVTSSGTDAGGIAGRFTGGGIEYTASYAVVYGNSNVGGVAGYMTDSAYIRYSYSKGEIGTLQQGGEAFGGLVGRLQGTNQYNPIIYSYSDSVIKGYNKVGGLIGYYYNINCYIDRYFNNCYVLGEITGNSDVGMMIGWFDWSNSYTQYFNKCYSAAKVGGIYSLPNSSYLSASNSYFNTENSGKQSDSYFIALTDEQFKAKDSFKNWDFDTVWNISPDKNNGYPYLRELGTDDYSVEDTYEYTLIHNEEELFKIRKDMNGKYKLANNIEITETWQPIGDSSKPFNGILDGNGFKISNFHILQNEEYEYTLAGMFGYIGRLGEVKNLTVETSDYGVATLNSGKYAGIIAADNYGKIYNCHVKGNVKSTDRAGGIAARNYGRIIDSSADVNVTNNSQAGGIAGYNSGNIQNTRACGKIKSGSNYVGGIAGSNDGYINNCMVENITIEGASYVGGIVGTGGSVYKCNANADIKGTSYVGGIAGVNASVAYSEAKCNIDATGERIGGIIGSTDKSVYNSSFTGNIISSGDYIGGIAGYTTASVENCASETDISGSYNIGGIAGYSTSSVTNCTSDADILGSSYIGGIVGESKGTVKAVSFAGTLIGTEYVGGIVGYTEGTITNSYSDCSVSGSDNVGGLAGYTNGTIEYGYSFSNVNGKNYVGGFVGKAAEKGSVTLCFAKGDVIGGDYVGGFAGANGGYMQYNYSIGKVTGSGDNVGGFLGSITGRILNSYYSSEISGQSDTGKGIPKTTEQMKKESVYIGWDFENVWKMQEDINSGYPYFESYKDKEEKEEIITEISDKEGFYAIADNPNGNYKLVNDIELDETISPFGSFSGKLDGGGHKIYGFSMNVESGDYAGLFESISAGGVVKNLTVEYKNITVGDGVKAAGAIAGRNYGTITNCAVSGDISGRYHIGGIIGWYYSVIESSSASGNVSGENWVGGIAGENRLSINNCQSKANVYGNRNTGGAVGYDGNGFVKLSSATGNVSKNSSYTTDEPYYVGGLIGYASGSKVDRCLTSNAVSGGSYVGGMVGYDNNATITMSTSSSAVAGSQNIGGFTGESYKSTISNCYSAGSVNGSSSYIGGFAGKEQESTISYCYSNCIVEGNAGNVGGFVGFTEYGKLENCYSAGSAATSSSYYCGGFVGLGGYSVTYRNCVTDSNVNGYYYVGGFVGRNGNSSSVFENCYARGKVTGKSYTYGFACWGYSPSTYTNCGYDATNNSYSDSYASGKTAEELAEINQYKNWDFEKNWTLNKDVSEYPYLSWQKAPGDLPTVIPAISVKISSAAYAVNVGEALSMQASLFPANATDKVVWSSSNENVAVVKSDGTVIAVSEGKATITVTAGTASASVEIEVVAQNKSGNIVKVITAPTLTVPYDTEIDEMLVMLPAVVEVMLSTGVVASLEVTWRHTAGTEYEFSGAISIPDNINITNTNNISATAKITKEAEIAAAKEIVSVPDVSLGVVNGTSLSTVLSMLPESVNVTLDDSSEAAVSVAWNEASEPYYNAFTSGEYIFTGKIVLPGDNSIKNTNGFGITAKVKVAGEEITVRDITSAMAQNNILIERYTTLNDVLEFFPTEVYAVVDNVQTVSLPVSWSSVSEPAYSPRVAGTYTFYGTFKLPEDGTVTNTLNIRPIINVVVSSSVSDEKAITVAGSTAEIGKSAAVSVAVDENTKMASGSIVIDYDAALLTPISYEIGDVISQTSAMVNINYIDPATHERKIKVSWVGANEINAGGELVKINFLISEAAADETKIKVAVKEMLIEDMDLNTIPFKAIDGTINAVSVILGDVNSDGKISIQDAFRILLMDIGRITFTDKQKLAADVNKDSVIDIFDAMKIQKYDIGLSDTLN